MKVLWVGVLVAAVVTVASLLQTPKYEASAQVLVSEVYSRPPRDCSPHPLEVEVKYQEGSDPACGAYLIPNAPSHPQRLAQRVATTIRSRPVAKETIGRLGLKMSPAKLLDNLTVQPVPGTTLIDLTYTDTDPTRAKRVANTVGSVASEHVDISVVTGATARVHVTAVVWRKAGLPSTPVSPKPLRSGLIALALALAVSGIIVAWRLAASRAA